MSTPALPETKQIATLLTDLLGRQVKATKGQRAKLASQPMNAIAEYSGDPVWGSATCIADMTLAACLGAALSLMPAKRALEVAKSGKLDEAIEENLREVCNIFGTLWSELAMKEFAVITSPPKDLKKRMHGAKQRIDMDVHVDGYMSGKLTVFVEPARA